MAFMAWLSELETRAEKWPAPARWLFSGLKWYLIVAGAIGLTIYYLVRLGLWTL